MSDIIAIVIAVIIIITIFILNLLKVIELFNRNNIVVKAKIISENQEYVDCYGKGYYNYTMEYKINDKIYTKKYTPFFGRKEYSYRKLVVNKIHGNIITTKLTRNAFMVLLIINSFFPFAFILNIIDYILSFFGLYI